MAASSRDFNERASVDIVALPHWAWNYGSTLRMPYRRQLAAAALRMSEEKTVNNVTLQSLDEELDRENPFIENHAAFDGAHSDFVSRPMVIPLPYGVRERCLCFAPCPDIIFVGTLSVSFSFEFELNVP